MTEAIWPFHDACSPHQDERSAMSFNGIAPGGHAHLPVNVWVFMEANRYFIPIFDC